MSQPFVLPTRQVHLDFHTGPKIPDVGTEFDAASFARTMKAAHVNSVTVFAKCHHGHLYYNTQHPARHPGLKPGLDLLGQQVEALHREGIRAPIYLSVQCDEFAANTHPEWIARDAETGNIVGPKPLMNPYTHFTWQILDLSTPYQDYLADQLAEVLKVFNPVDGIFFDMCWDQPSANPYFIRAMIKANLNPEKKEDRAEYARQLALIYMKRYHDMVKAANPAAGVFFNSRPLSRLAQDIAYQAQVEIEALPTGGWGYIYFPKNVRFARNFGKPYLGMTARFHKSWADFGGIKPYAALEYETAQMLAHGAACSIGDQLHPRGQLDKGAYELIGKAYSRVAEREAWCVNAKAVTDIGVFQAPDSSITGGMGVSGVDEGITRMFMHLKYQFNVVTAENDLSGYKLLVLPDNIRVGPELLAKLQKHVAGGGALLASGTSGLTADGKSVLLPELGIQAQGESPYQTTYLRFGADVSSDVPPSDHVCYERGIRVKATTAKTVASVVEPYFNRTWEHFSSHQQTPGNNVSEFAAATLNGKVAYISFPVFSSYATHGNYPYRLLVRNLVEKLLPDPLLRVKAPTSTEATVMRQENPARTVVHLLQYCPERRANGLDLLEDIVPLHDVPVSLKLAAKPGKVYLAPEGQELNFSYAGGRVDVKVPVVNGHAMIVFE